VAIDTMVTPGIRARPLGDPEGDVIIGACRRIAIPPSPLPLPAARADQDSGRPLWL